MRSNLLLMLSTFILLPGLFYSSDFSNNKQKAADGLRTAEEELAGFKVPEGFVVELVASEKNGIINPIDITFDDAGRLWTQTARMYPMDPIADIQWNDLTNLMNDEEAQRNHPNFKRILSLYQGKTKGTDQVLVLSDFYGDHKQTKTTVWADSLALPVSILPYKNGVYVAQGSEMFFLDDKNKDNKADERIPLLTGFGFTDTHTMAHTLVRGPGDWIYFSHGALNKGLVRSLTSNAQQRMDYSKIARFSLDAKKFELVTAGLNNIWGFQLRHNGQWYGCEANDLGYSVVPMEPGTAYPGIGNEKLRPYQPFMPELHHFRIGGTGISGLAFADDESGSFPAEWKDVAFLANPITSTINAVKIIRNPDGTVTAKHLPDLLTSDDKYFRPVNMEFGPDGCLYIADWYDKIISHNEIPTTHPDRDKAKGRIWRIRHVSQPVRKIPDFNQVKTAELVNYLKAPSIWMKRAAWHQLTDRDIKQTKKLASAIIKIASDETQGETTRILSLWSLEGIRHFDQQLMNALLKSPEHNLRREAIRSLVSFRLPPAHVAAMIGGLIEDSNPMVRSEVLRTLADMHQADQSTIDILVKASKPALPGNTMGGAYERSFERYLALKALEQYPEELYTYMNSSSATKQPVRHLFWAIQALPQNQKEDLFLKFWSLSPLTELDEPTFISVAQMLNNPKIVSALKTVLENQANAEKNLVMALHHQQQTQSPQLSALLEKAAQHLLSNIDVRLQQIALDGIDRLKIKTNINVILTLIQPDSPAAILQSTLRVLENNGQDNQAAFEKILKIPGLDNDLKLATIHSMAKVNNELAFATLKEWIPAYNIEQKQQLTKVLSGSSAGGKVLTQLYEQKLIGADAFNLSSAEGVYNADKNTVINQTILHAVKQKLEADQQAFDKKLKHYLDVAENQKGNAAKGKVLFQTCMMCHKVGNGGQNIAPALDGSANRETEALLTAIINPDAAVEGGYALYRITKKDDSTIEGYLFSKEDRGTTIAFMGGSKVFIEIADIKTQGFLGGRSFMPKGLMDQYSDQQVADLLAYIKSLK
jgi:putative membrane-bound dehydrogenase-like protein